MTLREFADLVTSAARQDPAAAVLIEDLTTGSVEPVTNAYLSSSGEFLVQVRDEALAEAGV